jgi:hypothetical protein
MPTDRDAERPANGNMFPEKGNKLHPENKAGPKVLGTRVSSELYEWMLNLPARWTEAAAEDDASA